MSKPKKVQDTESTQQPKNRVRGGLGRIKLKRKTAKPSPTPHLDALSKKYFDESLLIHGE